MITSLVTLEIMLKKIDRISIIKHLEIKKINKKLKELEAGKTDELEMFQENLKFAALKNIFLGRPNSIKDETALRKQTRKMIDNIERLKTEIKEIKEWDFKSVKLLEDLNF